MDEKAILNYGTGSPGETTRFMTKEYLKLKHLSEQDYPYIFGKILKARSSIYKTMGFNILEDSMIEKIIHQSVGVFPFVIIADIYVTNKVQGTSHIQAMFQYLDSIIEVVLDNYNSLVSPSKKYEDFGEFKLRVLEFLAIDSKAFGVQDKTIRCDLSFNSLYVTQTEDTACCLKFFQDGIVIQEFIKGDVMNSKTDQNNINKWFDNSYRESWVLYKVQNNKITFTIFREDGPDNYSGEICSGKLDLNIHLKINGYTFKDTYIKVTQ
jgi:hypothetical protein